MSYFPYPTPPLASGVITLRGDMMAKRAAMTPEEVEEYLDDHSEYDGMGERPDGNYDDGDGETGQVRA